MVRDICIVDLVDFASSSALTFVDDTITNNPGCQLHPHPLNRSILRLSNALPSTKRKMARNISSVPHQTVLERGVPVCIHAWRSISIRIKTTSLCLPNRSYIMRKTEQKSSVHRCSKRKVFLIRFGYNALGLNYSAVTETPERLLVLLFHPCAVGCLF